MPKPVSVELVSALKGWGMEQLLVRLHREVGTTGDVWVVRALSRTHTPHVVCHINCRGA